MPDLISIAGSFFHFLQVVIGFSLIIVIHELGHFLAARWAGVRVLAFAVGFGPAAFSYRKGLGLRRGSSDAEYRALTASAARRVSPTEYRLNWLPLGGYVKMLGQDDADPTATSDEPDSYQNAAVWKRMIVISAGVLFNLLTAALLFILVFTVGLKTQPPTIGLVDSTGPAAQAVATNAEAAGVSEPGLKPGDHIVAINGDTPEEFTDLIVAAAMSAPEEPVSVTVRRRGVEEPLRFRIEPERSDDTKLLGIGVMTSDYATTLADSEDVRIAERIRESLADLGLTGVAPGMTLTHVNGEPAVSAFEILHAARRSQGRPISLTFRSADGRTVDQSLPPRPELQTATFQGDARAGTRTIDHLLGLPPVMRVVSVERQSATDAGLRPDDLFARLGTLEWPPYAAGIEEVRRHAGGAIAAEVRRKNHDGEWIAVALDLPVNRAGTIGFGVGDSAAVAAFIGEWPRLQLDENKHQPWQNLRPAESLGDLRGRRILAVNGQPVESLLHLREVLRTHTAAARHSGADAATVTLTIERPADPVPVTLDLPWTLEREALALLHDDDKLGWESPIPIGYFNPAEVPLKAEDPAAAVAMGLRRTHRVMTMTYLTFVRLFQGSVKVEHLKGPVGIASLGTQVADKGFIWLLFFLALISVNLAVINFLPIPIADGGHFVFLLYEQITGRPPPLAVQNAAAIAGLVLIASVFIIVTFNDIKNLF